MMTAICLGERGWGWPDENQRNLEGWVGSGTFNDSAGSLDCKLQIANCSLQNLNLPGIVAQIILQFAVFILQFAIIVGSPVSDATQSSLGQVGGEGPHTRSVCASSLWLLTGRWAPHPQPFSVRKAGGEGSHF
ncbi:hypothetical protein [Stieleria mannarensis]|uniref:hypothetical protein n=1 Tax=Stieleria mannarensis TaxID=2755585 RepID=UPI001601E90E|nr:hypothetical protein [Rhodopirellula sp. JC639]